MYKKQCPVCSKDFSVKHKHQVYCSKGCFGKGSRRTHGFSGTRFYTIWLLIGRRCYDKKSDHYHLYGKRGIRCLWDDFESFKSDMYQSYLEHLSVHGKLDTTIERINNDGHYSKENCRWATRKEQSKNRRNRIILTYKGETRCLAEWAEAFGLKRIILWQRLYRDKWPLERALHTPISKGQLS